MADVEPIIAVLGPFGGGTSAVAGVLRDLGVFMGREFDWAWREPHETWEDSRISNLFRRAFTVPGGRLQMNPDTFTMKLREWADEHRAAAHDAGQPPGVKQPLLCVALDTLRTVWGAVVPVVVDRPVNDAVATLNRLGWWADERERRESVTHLIAERERALSGTAPIRVDFNELRAEPDVVIHRLVGELGLSVTDAQVQSAVAGILQPADVGGGDPYGENLLLARVDRDPDDHQVAILLAHLYYDIKNDPDKARIWYARWLETSDGPPEVTYQGMYRLAASMDKLGEPWPAVREAYLHAWEFRPTRAEPLYALAHRYRTEGRYRLGHLFAERAAGIPLPGDDLLFEPADVYAWKALDEQAVCASQLGEHAEAFTLFRRMLAQPGLPDAERPRVAVNRDLSVPAMLEAASCYPDGLAHNLGAGSRDTEVTVSLIAGPDRAATEQTLNSFLHCCTDISRAGRFLVIDTGLSAEDRTTLEDRYRFVDLINVDTDAPLPQLREQIHSRFWLHLGQGWRFFAPEKYLTRLTAVLHTEPQVFQVGINYTDATELTGTCAPESDVHRAPDTGRYVLTDTPATGPAMIDTTRPERGGTTATLDEVLCVR